MQVAMQATQHQAFPKSKKEIIRKSQVLKACFLFLFLMFFQVSFSIAFLLKLDVEDKKIELRFCSGEKNFIKKTEILSQNFVCSIL